ncbi:NUDIX hydrolase [Nocardioides terrisoli]|uniref:NUDIX hydrolase n=1 Tax=Nocardioides terrisoli TaxID=3388267 RepID=UPI00287B9D53|nr:NUDIX hydrolase [Nocardioides marmorisolisilvae]
MPQPAEVVAAGAVVTRRSRSGGGREVLLVHRPKYDDWSFPKGKRDPGEHIAATAVREVLEETGVRVRLGRPLPLQQYVVSRGRTKTVHYWVGRVIGDPEVDGDLSGYPVNDEIDALAWLPVDDAVGRLSHELDRSLLAAFRRTPKRTDALVVLRHAAARARRTWHRADQERPLTPAGREQAAALASVLSAFGVSRVVTSPSVRCMQTVAPFLEAHDLVAEEDVALSEEGCSPADVDALAARLLDDRASIAVCTHRPVLPVLLERLGVHEEPLAPAESAVCHRRRGRVVATERA